tara:strand:- start:44 stop:661 length:618 start_codon:yes stop_codon:yes gene_type:complete
MAALAVMKKVNNMADYDFVLRFQLQDPNEDPENYLDALFEAGCDDATVGVGSHGSISLNFIRESESAAEAIKTATQDVMAAIPGAKLTELAPDIMNTTEIADTITERFHKMTRQVVRKYATGQTARIRTRFPAAVISGSSPMWHLGEVLDWMVENEKINSPSVMPQVEILKETTQTVQVVNAAIQHSKRVPDDLMAMAEELVARR